MNLSEKLQLAYLKLQQAQRLLIIGHTSPDADALASMGAILEIANNLGLESYAYADKNIAGAYTFIPHENLISNKQPKDLANFDLILILDCGSIFRTGLERQIRALLRNSSTEQFDRRPYLIEFDHHQAQETYTDLEIRLPQQASTTQIIYHFLRANNLIITSSLANCILIGLITDTGNFLYANSSSQAIAVASEMLLRGASLPKIISHTVNNKSFSALKVWGRALENIQFNPDTGLIVSALSAEEVIELLPPEEAKLNVDLFGDIASFLSSLGGVRVSLFLREEEGQVKGSLRTNTEGIDLSKIAKNWGGGGHQKAAGFSLLGRLVKVADGYKVVKSV